MAYISKHEIKLISALLKWLHGSNVNELNAAQEALVELAKAYNIPLPKKHTPAARPLLVALADFIENKAGYISGIPEIYNQILTAKTAKQ